MGRHLTLDGGFALRKDERSQNGAGGKGRFGDSTHMTRIRWILARVTRRKRPTSILKKFAGAITGRKTHAYCASIRVPEMQDRIWNKGAPPHVGWWNASRVRQERVWRWWNGEYWSQGVSEREKIAGVRRAAQFKDYAQQDVEWTSYWPENARVPRVNPETETNQQG